MALKKKIIVKDNYSGFFREIKEKILASRIRAYRGINKELINLYMDIGRIIVDRQAQYKWGQSVVEKLSLDLRREFDGKNGFSIDNLWRMRLFYLTYKNNQKLAQLVPEIPWGHNILIMQKLKKDEEREYYIKSGIKFGWSRSVLLNQIKAKAYQRHKVDPKQHNFKKALPVYLVEQADESIKSVYNLDFLGITRPVLERELEGRLVEKIKLFILELGYGFSFIGNQYRLTLGKNEYFIDLLFFNRKLKSLVAIELKANEFKPEYAGKMDFYLNLLNDKVKMEDENPAVGIILCAEKDNLVVEYALQNAKNPMGVTEYQLTTKLPNELKKTLPSARQFKKLIQ